VNIGSQLNLQQNKEQNSSKNRYTFIYLGIYRHGTICNTDSLHINSYVNLHVPLAKIFSTIRDSSKYGIQNDYDQLQNIVYKDSYH
jgi:hypothetical protein